MADDIKGVLFSREHLTEIVRNLGKRISEDHKGKNLPMVSVLKGSFIFMTDLTRAIDIPCRIDFMSVSSYGVGTRSSGVVKITRDLGLPLASYDPLVVGDTLDNGVTLSYMLEPLQPHDLKSIKICTLSDKPERRTTQIMANYVDTHVPDGFVVGYGLDYNEAYRNPPCVGTLKPHVYGG